MTDTPCRHCGAPLDPDDLDGICPACLVRRGMDEPTELAPPVCTGCREPLDERARFCPQCGAPAPPVPSADADPVRSALEEKLRGQYRIVRLLGRGGMGAVYLARDLTLDREVAIKVIRSMPDARELHQRFRREARTSARLSHPNIVPLHAFGEVEGMPYFVMGFVRGESLATRLQREGRLEEELTRRILGDVAEALDHAHRQGVVHRDVKPDNILLDDESGRALLTDFGLAKALNRGETLTRTGGVMGTPSFMSPEQAAGREVEGPSDLYSLGVVGYAMLAGRLPFEGRETPEVLAQHLSSEPVPLRTLVPAASDSTVQAVMRCLAKAPADRWPDARSLARALDGTVELQLPDALQAVEGQGILALAVAAAEVFLVARFDAPPMIVALNALLMLAIYLTVLIQLRLQGFSLSLSQKTIWTEPSWWPFWYPAPLRRPGNVWRRLPPAVRRFRAWLPVLGLLPFACFWGGSAYLWPKVGLVAACVVSIDVLRFLAFRDLRRRGLTKSARAGVALSVPAHRGSFWARPPVAAVLNPDRDRDPQPRTGSPHDRLRSILRHGDRLQGPLRPIGSRAAVSARALLAEIERDDAEIASLAEDLEPGGEERLTEKIDSLGDAEPGSERHSMRELLERQRDLVRGLADRFGAVRERRDRRLELLRTLDLHVASLSGSGRAEAEAESISGRVRALCDDIARHIGGPGPDPVLPPRNSGLTTLDDPQTR